MMEAQCTVAETKPGLAKVKNYFYIEAFQELLSKTTGYKTIILFRLFFTLLLTITSKG